MSKYYKFDDPDQQRSEYLGVWLLILVVLVTSGLTWKLSHDKDEKIHKLQVQSKTYFDQAVQNQLNYERSREELTRVQQNLAGVQAQLRSASNEATRLRADRASRSRKLVPTVRRNLPDQQHATASSELYSGALRDITMYCPTGNSTASGKTPRRGMVATISRSIPFGTHVLIEGLGEYVVEDRIGHGSEFDIFTPSCSEANAFGRIHRRVTILETD